MKPGRWMGVIAFFFIIACLLLNYVIAIVFPELKSMGVLQDITGKAIIVFSVVWGAVFGSGLAKTITGNVNNKVEEGNKE